MKRVAVTLLMACGLPVLAQEDLPIDQSGVYVSDPAACVALEDKGMDAFVELDFLALTFDRGIQSLEFQCNFYQIKSRPNTPLLFADAVCSFPGALYPDIFAIAPNGSDSILVVSGADTTLGLAETDDPPSDFPIGTTNYHRCDTLSEIHVD